MRESWTDRRLDDFTEHTRHRFDEVDRRFDQVDRRFADVDRRFDVVERRMEAGFVRVDTDIRELRTEMNTRFDAMQRTMVQFGGVMIVALIGLVATQVGLFLAS